MFCLWWLRDLGMSSRPTCQPINSIFTNKGTAEGDGCNAVYPDEITRWNDLWSKLPGSGDRPSPFEVFRLFWELVATLMVYVGLISSHNIILWTIVVDPRWCAQWFSSMKTWSVATGIINKPNVVSFLGKNGTYSLGQTVVGFIFGTPLITWVTPGSPNGALPAGICRRATSWSRTRILMCGSWRCIMWMIPSSWHRPWKLWWGAAWTNGGMFRLKRGQREERVRAFKRPPRLWRCWAFPLNLKNPPLRILFLKPYHFWILVSIWNVFLEYEKMLGEYLAFVCLT